MPLKSYIRQTAGRFPIRLVRRIYPLARIETMRGLIGAPPPPRPSLLITCLLRIYFYTNMPHTAVYISDFPLFNGVYQQYFRTRQQRVNDDMQ